MPVRDAVHQTFTRALAALVEQIKRDRTILAAILAGSLSHDTVWDKSDIDLVLITSDDKKRDERGVSLYADAVNTHVIMIPRTEFRQMVEGSAANTFAHSFLAKGKLLYAHDESIERLCARLHVMGDRDRQFQLLEAGAHVLPSRYKAHKWFLTRRDLDYTALWILYCATPLARIEVISAGLIADREVIPQASTLNPAFFATVYHDLLNTKKTPALVERALHAVDEYLEARTSVLFGLVLDHLREVGETRTATEIDNHFRRNYGVESTQGVCEYLADRGLLVKASVPVKLTRHSNVEVQELAFVYA